MPLFFLFKKDFIFIFKSSLSVVSVGIEPTALRSRVGCTSDRASQAPLIFFFLLLLFVLFLLVILVD